MALFIVGFAYLNGYYSVFSINIMNFVSTIEVVYIMLPLVTWAVLLGILIVQGWVFMMEFSDPERVRKSGIPWHQKQWFFGVCTSIGCIVGWLVYKEPFYWYNNVSLIGLLFLFYGMVYPIVSKKIKGSGSKVPSAVMVFLFLAYASYTYGNTSGTAVRLYSNPSNIKFTYNSVVYQTDKTNLVYLGQTQSTLFIYLSKDSLTWVLPMDQIHYFSVGHP